MRKTLAFGAAAALAAASALAVSAHFLYANGTVDGGGTLVVDFKDAGLGNNVTANYLLETTASATYECYNRGNNLPQGGPFQVDDQPLSASGTFTSGRNGAIVGQLRAGPPNPAPAENALKCVSTSKMLCLRVVEYSNSRLSNTSFPPDAIGVTPDPASRSFDAPRKGGQTPANCYTSF